MSKQKWELQIPKERNRHKLHNRIHFSNTKDTNKGSVITIPSQFNNNFKDFEFVQVLMKKNKYLIKGVSGREDIKLRLTGMSTRYVACTRIPSLDNFSTGYYYSVWHQGYGGLLINFNKQVKGE